MTITLNVGGDNFMFAGMHEATRRVREVYDIVTGSDRRALDDRISLGRWLAALRAVRPEYEWRRHGDGWRKHLASYGIHGKTAMNAMRLVTWDDAGRPGVNPRDGNDRSHHQGLHQAEIAAGIRKADPDDECEEERAAETPMPSDERLKELEASVPDVVGGDEPVPFAIEPDCGVEQSVARQAHNLEVAGSSTAPAIETGGTPARPENLPVNASVATDPDLSGVTSILAMSGAGQGSSNEEPPAAPVLVAGAAALAPWAPPAAAGGSDLGVKGASGVQLSMAALYEEVIGRVRQWKLLAGGEALRALANFERIMVDLSRRDPQEAAA